jgi:hypothetical protein
MYTYCIAYIKVSIMGAEPSFPDNIHRLLQSNTVMPLKQLRHELGDRPRSSLFRDLKKLDLVTSYTHAGQYHALKSAARFDADGLWFFDQAGFAKHGTLKNTLIQIISNAQAGMTQKELKSLLRIKVQNALTHLVQSNAVERQLLPTSIYVYLSVEKQKAEDQLQRRLAIHHKAPEVTLPVENLIIEILLELIRAPNCRAEAKELGRLLRKRGIVIGDPDIVYVLAYYDIKKNRF